ncbi:MAG TPA: exopolysaccharide biosynthesis polyprenyl glycosylphosphotransferase [Methylomirabilota bacterium]|nr:exopolysaccharide biosynthesis polyprenyl glycosylphosphotransferase [Methylomirabilota bacterium]
MITQRNHGLFSLVTAAQLLVAVALYWGMFFLFNNVYRPVAFPERYVFYFALMSMGLLLEAVYRYKGDGNLLRKDIFAKHRIAVVQTLAAIIAIFIFLVATKDQAISRLFLFCFAVALYGAMLVSATVLPGWFARRTFHGLNAENTLLIGPAEKAWQLRDYLARKADLGINTIGLLCDYPNGHGHLMPVLGQLDDFERVVQEKNVSQAILVELPLSTETLNRMTKTCERLGVRLLIFNDLQDKIRHPISHFEDDGLLFFGLRNEPLQNPLNRTLKRVVDIAVSLPVVVLILPVLTAMVWFFQRVQSPGSVFFTQERNGFQKHRFKIWKFRTMHPDNADVLKQATLHDDRVYPAGRWFRKLSIDEFPQFINVLKGDMSVVGPRPHLPQHDEQFARLTDNFYVRKFVKPGITGLAQVNGFRGELRDTAALQHRIEYDIEYLENWSLGADLAIIGQTAVQVVHPPRTAY